MSDDLHRLASSEAGSLGPGTQAVIEALNIVNDAELQLAASEQRHRALVDAAVDAIITIDAHGAIGSFNPAAEQLLGYTRDEVIGRNVSALVPSPHRENHDGYIQNYLKTGVAKIIGFGREVEGVHKDGSLIPIHLSIGEFSANGKRQFVGMLHDLTERVRLQDDALQYAAIVESSDDAIIAKDLDGNVKSWNRGAQELYGYTPDEIIGKNVQVLIPPDHKDELAGILERIRSGGRINHFETVRQKKDGSPVFVSLNISPIYSKSGVLEGASAIARDISDWKDAQKKLEQLVDELEGQRDETEAQRQELAEVNERLCISNSQAQSATTAKSEFLANMSHEIRTPMTAILGYLDILEEQLEPIENTQQAVESIVPVRRSAEHLMALINDILDLSRIESGKLRMEKKRCSPSKLVHEAVNLLRSRAQAKDLELNTEFATPVPDEIETDPQRVRQILFNLIGNAIKFTQSGSIQLKIAFDQQPTKPLLRFEVIDTGVGIDEQAMQHIFQRFAQADSSITRRFGGSGLGLSICQKLVEQLGGEISAESVPGEGSIFRFTIAVGNSDRLKLVDQSAKPVTDTAQSRPTPSYVLPECKVLLVEDGIDNQRLIAHILKKAGANLTIASHGGEALEAHERANGLFDVVLMDVQMPVMDGLEATGHLRKRGFNGPIIALTAHAMEGDEANCLNAGCDAYLTKPIDKTKFFATINQQLERTQAKTPAHA